MVPKTACFLFSVLFLGACNRNTYECIERTENEVPNFQRPGTHTEVSYVLLHDGHKIYTNCDSSDFQSLDPMANCGFRVLGKYECSLGQEGGGQLSWDLKCTAPDQHTVYLYALKKE